jgi:hypothetical protein
MKYLCLVYFEGKALDALSEEQHAALDRDSLAYDRELQAGGHFVAAEALQAPHTAVTVRARKGTLSTTDGPFAETKEHLGGFILVEAKDLTEAVRIASKIPVGQYGSVEVRPVFDFSQPPK